MRLVKRLKVVRRHRDESGGSLVVVLIFITVFGLICAGLLTEASASVKFTSSVNTYESKLYAADAGVSFGIQQIHQNNDMCPGIGVPGTPIPKVTIPATSSAPAQTVDVSCQV